MFTLPAISKMRFTENLLCAASLAVWKLVGLLKLCLRGSQRLLISCRKV
jgi:hypothetical protein